MTLAALVVPVSVTPTWAATQRRAPVLAMSDDLHDLSEEGWLVTRCPWDPAELMVSKTFSLESLETVNGIGKDCPGLVAGATHRLMRKDLSPGRRLPAGVEIIELGGVSVTALTHFDSDGYARGVRSLSMTNWSTRQRVVRVVLHCTSDRTQWYY